MLKGIICQCCFCSLFCCLQVAKAKHLRQHFSNCAICQCYFMIYCTIVTLSSLPLTLFLLCTSGATLCQQVSSRSYTDSTKDTTKQELWTLLNNIHLDTKISAKERKRLLRQFYQAHPEIFNQYFGESVVSML